MSLAEGVGEGVAQKYVSGFDQWGLANPAAALRRLGD